MAGPGGARGLGARATLVALSAIVAVGLALRANRLDRHYFWYDEALILDASALARPAGEYARRVWAETTYNPGWPLLVWTCIRAGHDSLLAARVPSCAAGTLAIAAVFWACRELRLDRPTALLAALFTALSWPQVEYSQQVLPYAIVPLLAALCLALLGRIDRTPTRQASRRLAGWHLALLGVGALFLFIHNAFLLLLPALGIQLGLGLALRHRRAASSLGTRALAASRTRGALAAGTLLGLTLVSIYFYLPKRGDGYRTYLDAFYLPTFRAATPVYRGFLDQADAWYRSAVPPGTSMARPVDLAYFFASRTWDFLVFLLNPRYSLEMLPGDVAGTVPLVVLLGLGMAWLARGRGGRAASVALVGGASAFVLGFLLSVAKMYPFGGVRQLLPLAPWVSIGTAVGARRLCGRFPRGGLVLVAAYVALTLGSARDYFIGTRLILGRREIRALMQHSGTKAVVAGDCWWSSGSLRYLVHTLPGAEVLEATSPEFAERLRARRPFLLVSLNDGLLDWDPARGWRLADALRRNWPLGAGLSGYDIEPLMVVPGRPCRQFVQVYGFHPRPEARFVGRH